MVSVRRRCQLVSVREWARVYVSGVLQASKSVGVSRCQ